MYRVGSNKDEQTRINADSLRVVLTYALDSNGVETRNRAAVVKEITVIFCDQVLHPTHLNQKQDREPNS